MPLLDPAKGGAFGNRLRDFGHRTAFRIGYPLARAWWRITRARHEGALVAIHVGPLLLLVQESYRPEWNFPGGGVNAGETPEQAAHRELSEALAFDAPALTPAGTINGTWEGRQDVVHFFKLHLDQLPPIQVDNREITAARLFAPSELQTRRLTVPVRTYLSWTSPTPSK